MNPSSGAPRRALLIVNPAARRASGMVPSVCRAFEKAGVHCETIRTERAGHATTIARDRGAQFDMVFTLGGDGTAMEVITALADQGSGPPVGILAGGTGNVIARALGISLRVQRAVGQLLEGDEARIDLGQLHGGRHFAIGLGVGLDEAMIAGASPLMKKRLGFLAYIWSAAKASLRLETFRVRLTVDGRTHEQMASLVIILNLGTVPLLGRELQFGRGILYDDGILHACLFSPTNIWQAMRIFIAILRGRTHADPAAYYESGKTFRLETEPSRRVQADGELLEWTPIEITVRPQAARLLIPRRSSP